MMMVMAVAFRLHLRLPAGAEGVNSGHLGLPAGAGGGVDAGAGRGVDASAGGGVDAGAGEVAPLDVRVQVTPG